MANAERGESTLEVGGKVYTLKLTLNAMCEIEEALSLPGKLVSIQDVSRGVLTGRAVMMRAYVWGALRKYHPKVTLLEAGDLIESAGGIAVVLDRMAAVVQSAVPDEADVKALEGEKPEKRPPPNAQAQ